MSEATTSHLAMYRAVIALAWADHSLDEKEQIRIHAHLDNNKNLSDAQREQLKQDMHQSIKMDDVWSDITDVQDRAHVINIADTLFWEDGDFSHSEKEVYEKIKAAHMATLDLDFIREDVRNFRKVQLANRKQFQQELHEMRGSFARMMHYLETMVNKAF